jgi:GGDEF domain-containing protein
MGMTEAARYVREHRKRQDDPFLWPDFLTGLPDRAGVLKKLQAVMPKLGTYAVGFVRIANIQSYLIKYGPDKHADIIQWAAGILQTTCSKCGDCFVGTLGTHEFVVTCEANNMAKYIKAAARLFERRVGAYYSADDLKKKETIAFYAKGIRVKVGLLRLVGAVADRSTKHSIQHLLQDLSSVCDDIEGSGDNIAFLKDD